MEQLVNKCKELERENVKLREEISILNNIVKIHTKTIGRLIDKFITHK